jgi:predicted ribosomally synthesized peptide with nif11-like leader
MSLEQATALIERMKSDEALHNLIMASGSPDEKMAKWKAEGFECTVEDIKTLHAISSKAEFKKGSLPLSWQCKGPCHTKCADIVQ